MKKVINAWNGFVGEINSSVSERDCKKFSILYAIVAIFMAIAGWKKSKWYLLGTIVYAVFAGALFQSYKEQRRARWAKYEEELNEPVEK